MEDPFIKSVKKGLKIGIIVILTLFFYDIFTHKAHAEVVGSYKSGKYMRNVASIDDWQTKIAKDIGMPFKTQIYARVIQNQECGDENGFCLNRIDCGPFQVNQVHKKEFAWCKIKVQEGIKEVNKAKKTHDWSKVIAMRNEVYKSQLTWVWGRMKDQVKRFEIPEERVERIRQLCVYHNGGKHRQEYGMRCIKTYKILLSHYNITK